MENHISGLANYLNFKVDNQIIFWDQYQININRIAMISIGTSKRYTRKPKERGPAAKLLNGVFATMSVLGQMASEVSTEWGDTISGAIDLYLSEKNLPCLNLTLINGVTVEITFSDLWTFKDAVIAVKEAYSLSGQFGDMIVDGTDIRINGIRIGRDAAFTEFNALMPQDLPEVK
ncbi:MAG: hypothetical protein HFH02_03940 [Dorea sp.]|nr:hypothetical protein [Dorea sp.]